nr:septal ring lytic transglycosylase RlpA family protein [uncultured Rhodoferax sp.]
MLLGLGAVMLVGCATPTLPSPVPPPTGHAHPPLAKAPPALPPLQEQAIAPIAHDSSPLMGDQSQAQQTANEPWKQRGLASWYGKKFNGRRTASGERFSAAGFTAAHRTLPIPSYVRVRRVASGDEVIVRINDRGPFHSERVLDLSFAAANKLGMVALGSAEVEMELVTEEDGRYSGNSATPGIVGK